MVRVIGHVAYFQLLHYYWKLHETAIWSIAFVHIQENVTFPGCFHHFSSIFLRRFQALRIKFGVWSLVVAEQRLASRGTKILATIATRTATSLFLVDAGIFLSPCQGEWNRNPWKEDLFLVLSACPSSRTAQTFHAIVLFVDLLNRLFFIRRQRQIPYRVYLFLIKPTIRQNKNEHSYCQVQYSSQTKKDEVPTCFQSISICCCCTGCIIQHQVNVEEFAICVSCF